MTRIDGDKLGEQLSAYLDGELNDEDRAAVEATLRDDSSARAELARLRETAHAVSELPRREAPGSLAADVMATIERGDLLNDDAPPEARSRSWRSLNALLTTAAMIAVAVTVGLWGISQSETTRSSAVVSRVDVDDDLERDILRSKPRRDTSPPVAAMARRPVPREHHDAIVDEVVQVTPPPMKAKAFGQGGGGHSGFAAATYAAPDVYLDVTCPNEVDLRRCADRVSEFMPPRRRQSRNEYGDSAVAVRPNRTGLRRKKDEVVTVEQTLRIPSSRLRFLVDALEEGDPRRRDVALTIGTMVQAQGWRQAKQLSEMVVAQAVRNERQPMADQPYTQESHLQHPVRLKGRTRPTAVTGFVGGIDEGDAKTTESKKVIDEWLKRFGVQVPQASESEEATAAPDKSLDQDRRPAARSTPEQLISVIVRFRAPADSPPPGPPGQLVPRDR